MVSLTRSQAVLELGRRLVSQLDADDDLLASWMSHYIAQLIEGTKRGSKQARAAAQEACAHAILELWKYRASLPGHVRPLTDIEPAIRALASLDVERTDYRYYPQVLRGAKNTIEGENTRQWLELATGIDSAARLLIRFALRCAAEHAVATTETWVALAAEAGAEGGMERQIIRSLLLGEGEADQGAQGAALRSKVSKLEGFVELATHLLGEMRAQVEMEDIKK